MHLSHANALWLLRPVKPFAESKSRLSPPLDSAARAALSRDLLRRVLLSAGDANLFAGVVVVSRDADVRACATPTSTPRWSRRAAQRLRRAPMQLWCCRRICRL